jgi:hypothetical protein
VPGEFSKSSRPKRPGAYVNFEAVERQSVPPSIGSVVAIPIVHDWGPYKQNVLVGSLAEFQAVYGASQDTPGFMAVQQAFRGEGLAGRGGAGAVLVHRFGGSAAAKSTRTLSNTTPATSLTLTAKYEGTRGDDLRVTVQDYAADSSKTELILYDGGVELERYLFADTNINDLRDQINLNSDWVTAVANITGVALAPVSSVAFSGGNDGTTVVSGDWTNVMTALEPERFSVLSPFDLTDSSILASLKTWTVNLNSQGKRFFLVIGGALDETITTAVTRSGTLNDEDIINVGVGSVIDDGLLDVAGNPVVLSTSQLAPRIAGVVAQRGEAKSLTFARLADLRLRVGPTEAGILTAFDGGVTVLSRDSHSLAPVRIEKGLTTYTANSAQKPYTIFRTPKFVRTMQGLELELEQWSTETIIGELPVNDKTRDAVIAFVRSRLQARQSAGIVQPGWSVSVDPDPPPSDDDDFIAVLVGLHFGRSAEQVFFTIRAA